MIPDADLGKSRILFEHLIRATKSYNERETAREKLQLQIKKLKNLSTKSLRTHIDELQKRIDESITKEKRISSYQQREEIVHQKLQEKIRILEEKLGRYLDTRESRIKRIRELEDKIKNGVATKNEKVAIIEQKIQKLETLYRNARKDKKSSKKRLEEIRNRITSMKKQLKSLY